MQLNMQRESANSGEFEQTSSSVDGQFLVALRKMMKKEIEVMVINAVHQVVVPTIEVLVRKVVKEEIQSAQRKLLSGGNRNCANEMTRSGERSLQLKFSDEVSLPVLTGKVLIGKTGNPMMVSLIDSTTGEVVDCEPESSAKVEMLLLDASDDDKESNWSPEDFNSRIISEDDKEKPHLAKNKAKYNYVRLKKGVGALCNPKLGHDARWLRSCKCRLGARIAENFRGNKVKEALTESFVVSDSRSKLYEKHHPPFLSDEVWRLENIGKDGAPCQRLNKKNIWTVQDFLFLHSIDPQTLQQILGAGAKTWKETVDHAQSCTIDNKKLYLHRPSAESKMGVVFDAVGGLKGLVVNQSHYAPIDNLSADEKDCAHKLLLSAFQNQEEKTPFDDEASLLHQFPRRPSDINASGNYSIQKDFHGCDLMIAENINSYFPTEPGSSSLSFSPYIITSDLRNNINRFGSLGPMDSDQPYDTNLSVPIQLPSCQLSDLENINGDAPTDPGSSSQSIYQFGSLESTGTGQLNESIPMDTLLLSPSCQFSYFENINRYDPTSQGTSSQSISFGFGSPGSPTTGLLREHHSGVQIPSCQTSSPDFIFETCRDNWSLTSLINPKTSRLSETLRAESHSHEQSRAFRLVGRVVNAKLWVVRAKKRKRVMALGGMPVLKKQMT